jgi:hypothetical protein
LLLAKMLESGGRLDAAELEYHRTIALHEKAIADFPNEAVFSERLAAANRHLVQLLGRREKLPETKAIR